MCAGRGGHRRRLSSAAQRTPMVSSYAWPPVHELLKRLNNRGAASRLSGGTRQIHPRFSDLRHGPARIPDAFSAGDQVIQPPFLPASEQGETTYCYLLHSDG